MNHLYKLLITLPLMACGGSGKKTESPMGGSDDMKMEMKMGMAAPSAASAAILDGIKDYASWPKFDEMPAPAKSEGHMNMFVLGFHNQVVSDAIARSGRELPLGFGREPPAQPPRHRVRLEQAEVTRRLGRIERANTGELVLPAVGVPVQRTLPAGRAASHRRATTAGLGSRRPG